MPVNKKPRPPKPPLPPKPPKPTGPRKDNGPTPKPKTVQSMREAAKNLAPKKAIIRATGSGTPTRASATTAPRRPRDVGTAYIAKPKNPRGNVDATRYGRAVGTSYRPKAKQMPKAY
jgi:hypothetical protein